MSDTLVVPDYLLDVRYWLRADPTLSPLHDGRVFFRMPPVKQIGGWPVMRIFQSGGSGQVSPYVPEFNQRIAVHVLGNAPSQYTALRTLITAFQSVVWERDAGLINPTGLTYLLSASSSGIIDSEDPDMGWPRLITSLVINFRVTGAGDSSAT